MLNDLWSAVKRIFGLEVPWEVMTLSRVGIDPLSTKTLTRVLQPAHTVRLRPEPELVTPPVIPRGGLAWHGITDTGLVRMHNEDSLALLDLGKGALFAVADGMGGHDAGEVASSLAVETVIDTMKKHSTPDDDRLSVISQAIGQANRTVKCAALRRQSNMGTTLTAALIADGIAYIGSVGDSRAYWIENGSIRQITRDHSLVQSLVESGALSREAARTDSRAHLLLRTIGNDDVVTVDAFRIPLSSGGTLLLCTDGLWGELNDDELHEICTSDERTEVICARLVQRANRNGGKDNITAIVIKVG
jgi:serine/threonine protein phosphatase PrpC